MKIEAVSINGEVYPPDEAKISAADRGFMFAHGAFETFRVSEGKIFLFDEHFARLDKNLKALNISWTLEPDRHIEWIKDISSKIPADKDGRVRFCVTSGNDGQSPNIIIYLDFIEKFKPLDKKAWILKSINRHRPEYFAHTGFRIKSLEYSYVYMARKELADEDTEGILLNPEGYIAEALTSNILWAKDGEIYTPPLDLGILAGTMRSWLMKSLNVKERLAKQEELFQSDEIFLTAGASYLTGINQINDIPKPGVKAPIYQKVFQTIVSSEKENSILL